MKRKNHEILENEFKRTFPIYFLGMFFHIIELYLLYKIPTIIGDLLDLFLQENGNKSVIMDQVYSLLFYSVILILPRMIYRTLYFMEARSSDTILRKKVIEHLQTVKPEYFEKEEKGTFLAYLSKEILSIRKFLGDSTFYFVKLIISPIIGLLVIGNRLNSLLSLTLIPIFPIAIWILFKLYQKYEKIIENERRVYVDYSNVIEQNTSGFSLIKLYNEQENQKKKFETINQITYQSDYNVGDILNQIDLVIEILYGLCYSLGFAVGLCLIQKGLLTVGELTAYISCITMVISEIVSSIRPLMDGFAYFRQATRRFHYFFYLEAYSKEGEDLSEIHKLEIRNLSYSYDKSQNFAIQNINMTIRAGEKIGIVGKIGSGKTTLMNIIAGFYEVPNGQVFMNDKDINSYSREAIFKNISFRIKQGTKVTIAGRTGAGKSTLTNVLMKLYDFQSGRILIGDQDLSQISIQSLRANISYISQNPYIFADTLRNNVILGNTQITDLQIMELVKEIGVESIFEKLEDGLDTMLNLSQLSYGELQVIAFIRAILHKANIYIFDEPTSNLDLKTEKMVQNIIDKIAKESTVIVIAHRKSTIASSEKVIYLKNGEIDKIVNKELV